MKQAAEMIRQIADKVESGEVQGICYVVIEGEQVSVEYAKMKGITMFEVLGAATHLQDYMQRQVNEDRQR